MVLVCTLTITKARECVEQNSNYTPVNTKTADRFDEAFSKQRHSQIKVIINHSEQIV